jgi:response regulator of citrate/malate metabolism
MRNVQTKTMLFVSRYPQKWLIILKTYIEELDLALQVDLRTQLPKPTRRSINYDLVLLDNLSDQSDISNWIQSITGMNCPVLVATDDVNWKIVRDFFRAGVNDCIQFSNQTEQNFKAIQPYL